MKIQESRTIGLLASFSAQAISRTGLMLFLAGFFLFGLSSGATLPIASGNQWVYSYRNVDDGNNTDDHGLSSGTRSTTEGILIMTMGSVARRFDSTFFSITYSDSGFYTYHYYNELSGKDTSVDSAYKGSCIKDYFVVNDAIYQIGSYGGWQPENDIPLSYKPENDSAFSTGISNYSRKTMPVVVRAGTDSAAGFAREISLTTDLMGMFHSSSTDTIRWSDKFGMVFSDSQSSSSSSNEDGGGSHLISFSYVLLSFRNVPTGIANFAKGSSARSALLHSPASRKAVMMHPAMKAAPGTRLFSLTGKQLSNRIGRQILILAP
jgi:hypothetical protein